MRKFIIFIAVISISCKTVDLEKEHITEIQKAQEEQDISAQLEMVENVSYEVGIEPEFITIKEPIIIAPSELERNVKKGDEAIKQAMSDAIVTPENTVGGTHIYDYDENKQFPITTKRLAMTVIQLEPGEETLSPPYLSDSIRWEIAGDLWVQNKTETQLVMIKPLENGLSTNMLIITNRRLYNFILTSTKNIYQPMVKFRYPKEPKFISSKTKRLAIEEQKTEEFTYSQFLSYNYTIRKGIFLPVEWAPLKVYDDGHKTYLVFPEMILQKEMPTVFEKSNNIINYRMKNNIMIVDKLIDKATIKLGKRKVVVKKKKGLPQDISKINNTPSTYRSNDFIEEDSFIKETSKYKLSYKTFTPPTWSPIKVYDDGKNTYLVFIEGYAKQVQPIVTDMDNNVMMYETEGDMLKINGVRSEMNLTYKNETITVKRTVEKILLR